MVATTIIREVYRHESNHNCCQLSILSCAQIHPHQCTACWIQKCSTPEAVEPCGNQEIRSWHLHNSWHILVCVCVCAHAHASMLLCYAYHNISMHAWAHTHTLIYEQLLCKCQHLLSDFHGAWQLQECCTSLFSNLCVDGDVKWICVYDKIDSLE